MFETIINAILYSHNHFVLHLDLKSENILIDAEQPLKVIDFGIATLLAETDSAASAPYSLISAAPEQLEGQPVSVQTDIFALGLLLHHLLTDSFPRRQPDGGVRVTGEDVPADLRAIVAKCLKTNPADRYVSLANQELARAEWALENAETQTDVATTYADSLQIIFGQQENTEDMKAILIDRWQSLIDNPDSTDAAKANISFALGKHFHTRYEFAQAQEILEPWLKAGYGNLDLQRGGKALLAETYLQVEDGRKAAKTVIEVAEMYKGTFAENSPDHVRDLMKASYYSHDRAIMEEPER